MAHTRIYAVILGLFLCCLAASAEKPRREKGDRKAGVSTLPLGMAKDKKGKKVGVSTLPLNMDKAKKGKKGRKSKFDQKSNQRRAASIVGTTATGAYGKTKNVVTSINSVNKALSEKRSAAVRGATKNSKR